MSHQKNRKWESFLSINLLNISFYKFNKNINFFQNNDNKIKNKKTKKKDPKLIRMISEGSCDTKVWSNDAENALHHRNKLYF